MHTPVTLFPNAQDFTIAGNVSFNNVQGDQKNYTNAIGVPGLGSTLTINSNELASVIREMGLTALTVNNVLGSQYNQVSQQEKIERTIFDDVSLSNRVLRHLADS